LVKVPSSPTGPNPSTVFCVSRNGTSSGVFRSYRQEIKYALSDTTPLRRKERYPLRVQKERTFPCSKTIPKSMCTTSPVPS
jgi:hypothetical protein